jgi:hypothetical protein
VYEELKSNLRPKTVQTFDDRRKQLQKVVDLTTQELQTHNVYQCRWFSPSTPASSTTKTGRHDIAKILLKVASKHQKSNQTK